MAARPTDLTAFFCPQPDAGREWCWGLKNSTGHSFKGPFWRVCDVCGKGHCRSCCHVNWVCTEGNILKCDCTSDEDLSDSNEARAMVRRRTTPSDDETETPPCSNRLVATFQDTSSDDDLSDGAEARVMREARARRTMHQKLPLVPK